MKLIYDKFQLSIEFHENSISVLTLENPATFTAFLQDLYGQNSEEEEYLVLFEKNKKINLGKCVEIVNDPFSLNVNNRKVLGKLYQELKEISDEEYLLSVREFNTKIIGYLDELSLKVPYPIRFHTEIDVQEIFKTYGIEMELETESLIEKVIAYMEIMKKLCHISLLIFVNLKCFLKEDQLLELYKAAFYCKMNVLLVESIQRTILDGESNTVLDEENCVIQF